MDQVLDLQVQMDRLYMEVSTQQCQGPTPSLHYHLQLQVLDFPPTETSQDCTLYPVSVFFLACTFRCKYFPPFLSTLTWFKFISIMYSFTAQIISYLKMGWCQYSD